MKATRLTTALRATLRAVADAPLTARLAALARTASMRADARRSFVLELRRERERFRVHAAPSSRDTVSPDLRPARQQGVSP